MWYGKILFEHKSMNNCRNQTYLNQLMRIISVVWEDLIYFHVCKHNKGEELFVGYKLVTCLAYV